MKSDMENYSPALNPHQLDILKLFSRDLGEEDFIQIKKIIVNYLATKATAQADKIWDKNNWDDKDAARLLATKERTPYNPHN